MIVLFSRAIRTGKTTELMGYCRKYPGVAGILMPDAEGKRMFFNISDGIHFSAEAENQAPPNEAAIKVGKFIFLRSAFDKANQTLQDAVGMDAPVIIVDEVGKLELRGEGFYSSVLVLKKHITFHPDHLLILVVRDELLNDVISFFALEEARVIHSISDL